MRLKVLEMEFSVCKIRETAAAGLLGKWMFYANTDEECSLVCPSGAVPEDCLEREDGWRAFRIEGVLDFSLIGILAKISGILAACEIGIFVVSTYNTDYIFVKERQLEHALHVLEKEYEIIK